MNRRPRLLHLGTSNTRFPERGPFRNALAELADLTIVRDAETLDDAGKADLIRRHDVLLLIWGCAPIPELVWENPGELRYILQVGGGCPKVYPIYDHGIVMTNWGDASAQNVAEGAMALLLATLKDIPAQVRETERGGSHLDKARFKSGTLNGLKLGVYGYGFVGRRFVEMARPFLPQIAVFDPYAEVPDCLHRTASLTELFDRSEAVGVFAAYTEQTHHSIDGDLLRRLPDGGVLFSVVRGEIAVRDDLFAEALSGRLRIGWDVLAYTLPEPAIDDPIRACDNALLTWHDISHFRWPPRSGALSTYEKVTVDNLRRFAHGEPLQWIVTREQLARMT